VSDTGFRTVPSLPTRANTLHTYHDDHLTTKYTRRTYSASLRRTSGGLARLRFHRHRATAKARRPTDLRVQEGWAAYDSGGKG